MRETGQEFQRAPKCLWLTLGWCAALVLALPAVGCRNQSTPQYPAAAPRETPQRIYTLHCLGCHGAKGEGAMGSNIQGLNRSVDQIVAVIANGEDKMPAFKGHLSDPQMRAVAAYVRTFKLPRH